MKISRAELEADCEVYQMMAHDIASENAARYQQLKDSRDELLKAVKLMLEYYGPTPRVAHLCEYPDDHPITISRTAVSNAEASPERGTKPTPEQIEKAAAFYDHIEKARKAGKDWWSEGLMNILKMQIEQDRRIAEMVKVIKDGLREIDVYLTATAHVTGVEAQRKDLIKAGNAAETIASKAEGR